MSDYPKLEEVALEMAEALEAIIEASPADSPCSCYLKSLYDQTDCPSCRFMDLSDAIRMGVEALAKAKKEEVS